MLLMVVTGYIFAYLYPIFGVPQFFYLAYNLLLWVWFYYAVEQGKEKWQIAWGVLFFLQFPFYFLLWHSNYIFLFFIGIIHLTAGLVYWTKRLWVVWVVYLLGIVWIIFFPNVLFFTLRAFNLLVTGNLFFLHI